MHRFLEGLPAQFRACYKATVTQVRFKVLVAREAIFANALQTAYKVKGKI